MKDSAVSFLKMCASGHAREAFEKYVGNDFKHHKPYFKGDAVSLRDAMQENAEQYPGKIFEVQRALEEGDLVAVHSRVQFDEKAQVIAVVHIFRFDAGKVVELWDVGQLVPEHSPNEYGVF